MLVDLDEKRKEQDARNLSEEIRDDLTGDPHVTMSDDLAVGSITFTPDYGELCSGDKTTISKLIDITTTNTVEIKLLKEIAEQFLELKEKLPILDKISYDAETNTIIIDDDVNIKVTGRVFTRSDNHIIRCSGYGEIDPSIEVPEELDWEGITYSLWDNPPLDEKGEPQLFIKVTKIEHLEEDTDCEQ